MQSAMGRSVDGSSAGGELRGSPVTCAPPHVPLSLGTRMIELVGEGGCNAVEVILLDRRFGHARRASCGTAPGGRGRGRLAWRRALLSSSGVLRQPALPRHSPTQPEPTVGTTLRSPAEPTSILFGAPALFSPHLNRSLRPHPPEPSGEGSLHAADRASSRLAGTCCGSHGAARLRRCRLAEQHAVADGGRGKGEGQGGAEGVWHVTPPLIVPGSYSPDVRTPRRRRHHAGRFHMADR